VQEQEEDSALLQPAVGVGLDMFVEFGVADQAPVTFIAGLAAAAGVLSRAWRT
jgi:hypothetical protein